MVGAVSDERWARFDSARRAMLDMKSRLMELELSPQGWARQGITVQFDGVGRK